MEREAVPDGAAVPPKPPLGLRPCGVARHEYARARLKEIAEAIGRYADAKLLIPPEWATELKELI